MTPIEFNATTWWCRNTYDTNFRNYPETGGVYIITTYDLDTHERTILYIGSAKNLKVRLKAHEVKRMLHYFYDYIAVFFLEFDDFRQVEKELIRKYRPQFNKQFNG
jgi:excinuclease UvrABC nuclease subunit